MTANGDRPIWIRWHQLPRTAADALLKGQARLYLAYHPYEDKLAVIMVPADDRITLTRKATHGRVRTSTVTMTTVLHPPLFPPRGPTSTRNGVQKR